MELFIPSIVFILSFFLASFLMMGLAFAKFRTASVTRLTWPMLIAGFVAYVGAVVMGADYVMPLFGNIDNWCTAAIVTLCAISLSGFHGKFNKILLSVLSLVLILGTVALYFKVI